jgi:hypothetical protein
MIFKVFRNLLPSIMLSLSITLPFFTLLYQTCPFQYYHHLLLGDGCRLDLKTGTKVAPFPYNIVGSNFSLPA